MSNLLFVLILLTTLANFGDFLIAQKGDQALRERLLRFYVGLEGDWRKVYQLPAAVLLRYLESILGSTPIQFVLRTALYTAMLTLVVGFPQWAPNSGWYEWLQLYLLPETHRFFQLLYFPNLIGDIISWSIAAILIRLLNHAQPKMAFVIVILMIISAVFCFALVIFLEGWMINFHLVEQASWQGIYDYMNFYLSTWMLFDMFQDEEEHLENFQGVIPYLVTIPFIVLSATTFIGLAIYCGRRFLEPALELIVRRLDSRQKPILTVIAVCLSAVATLLTAWLKAQGN